MFHRSYVWLVIIRMSANGASVLIASGLLMGLVYFLKDYLFYINTENQIHRILVGIQWIDIHPYVQTGAKLETICFVDENWRVKWINVNKTLRSRSTC